MNEAISERLRKMWKARSARAGSVRFGIPAWRTFLLGTAVAVGVAASGMGSEALRLQLEPPPGLNRAEIYWIKTDRSPRAVLVLCPGANGNGKSMIDGAEWQRFAGENDLGLLAISFASPVSLLKNGKGYYIASSGSGQVLLDGVREAYGRDLPLLLYGFSGGAHFTSRFVEWKPGTVLGWCAYSAAWWDEPRRDAVAPPGIVACGEYDGPRYGASIVYFKQGRAAGKPWLWVSLAKTAHARSEPLDAFVREYFHALLAENTGLWVDVDRETEIIPSEAAKVPALSGWLPAENLLKQWQQVHEP